MNNTIKYIILGAVLIIVVGVSLVFILSPNGPGRNQITQVAVPTPIIPEAEFRKTESGLTRLQKTVIGKTTEQEIAQISGAVLKQLPNGDREYSYPSEYPLWPNRIITSNGIVIFEAIVLPENSSSSGYDTLSNFITKYGEAEKVIPGSERFGEFTQYYIYAKQGIAVIAGPHDDKIYEIQKFIPTTVSNYENQFGQDILRNITPEGDRRI